MKYDERCVKYLMDTCGAAREIVLVALQHNGGSVMYSMEDLRDDAIRGMFMREARENG